MTYVIWNMKRDLSEPTAAELEILQVLWRSGPLSVREVWQALGSKGSYTTVLKLLQVMTEKRLVERDTSQVSHIYSPLVAREASQKQLVAGLLKRGFGGSVSQLIMSALSAQPASREELEAIQNLLNRSAKQAADVNQNDGEQLT
ncbi:MAG: BlaI/MecI/CopY family transcriptional regulator [Candidatus Methylacidiphilales bacterium]